MYRLPRFLAAPLAVAVTMAAFAFPARSAEPSDLSIYAHPQTLVGLPDGRRLNLLCMGRGSPTVILEGGLGTSSFTWRQVQPLVAKVTRVCAYDRAGLGLSDPGPMPRDPQALAQDLDDLLTASKLRGPYVMVAQSMGVLPILINAGRRPDKVAGILLVDPTFRLDLTKTYSPSAYDKVMAANNAMRVCAKAVMESRLEPGSALDAACGREWIKPGYSRALTDYLESQRLNPVAAETALSELNAVEENDLLYTSSLHRFGALPLTVLTAADTLVTAPFGLTPEEREAAEKARTQMHEQYRDQSSIGVRRVVTGSGHAIHLERPEVVAAATVEIVEAVRALKGAP